MLYLLLTKVKENASKCFVLDCRLILGFMKQCKQRYRQVQFDFVFGVPEMNNIDLQEPNAINDLQIYTSHLNISENDCFKQSRIFIYTYCTCYLAALVAMLNSRSCKFFSVQKCTEISIDLRSGELCRGCTVDLPYWVFQFFKFFFQMNVI